MPRPRYAYVGCFTTAKRKARGKGVAVFRIDPASGRWIFVEACDFSPNPHYVALDHSQRRLYSAHGDSSDVGSYARDAKTGKLTFLNKQPTGGDNSSTVAVDAKGGIFTLNSRGVIMKTTGGTSSQFYGGGGPGTSGGLLFDREGFLYCSDAANVIWKFAPDGTKTEFCKGIKAHYMVLAPVKAAATTPAAARPPVTPAARSRRRFRGQWPYLPRSPRPL